MNELISNVNTSINVTNSSTINYLENEISKIDNKVNN